MKFAYVAIAGNEEVVRGTLTAESRREAERTLKGRSLKLVTLEEKGWNLLHRDISLGRLTDVDRLFFVKHLSVMLKAGIPIFEALNMLKDQARGRLKTVLRRVVKQVASGSTLAHALGRFPKDFPELMVHLIESGEIAGTLDANLDYIAEFMKKEAVLKKKVKGALLYPFVIFIAVLAVMMGIGLFVLPQILPLFGSLDVDLPLTTQILIWMANLFKAYGVLIVLALFGAALGTPFLLELKWMRPVSHRVYLRLPIVGKLIKELNLARFFRIFGTLMDAGMPIDRSLRVTHEIIRNAAYKAHIEKMICSITQGISISRAVKVSRRLFPPVVGHMIKVGEKSGKLSQSAHYLGDFYEEELDDKLKNLSTLLEPILLLTIGLLVAWVAFSIIGPIYSLSGGVQ